jgi:hypothetical protein
MPSPQYYTIPFISHSPSIYHFFGLMGNTTTIEGWEKDKAATLVRRGRIEEVSTTFFHYTTPVVTFSSGQIPLRPRQAEEHRIHPWFQTLALVLAYHHTR